MNIHSKLIILVFCLHIFSSKAQQVAYQPLYTSSSFNAKTIDQSKPVGLIQGTPSVSLDGKATYSIPIFIPDGVNGMQPTVSINYNSGNGNGLLGFGWNLSAVSAITYDKKDIYHDGVIEPCYIDNGNPFLLNGERLIPINGTNGANGTEYRTEQESFSRIKSYENSSNCNTCPQFFEVETKSGIKMEYGTLVNNNTQLKNSNNTLPAIWYLSKTSDLNGNYIEYKYKIQNGEHLLDEIIYTKNVDDASLITNSIKFEYLKRADCNKLFILAKTNGNNVVVNKMNLLDKIIIKAENAPVKEYGFMYGTDSLYSYLTEIKEKSYEATGSSTAELNSTIFRYGSETNTISENTSLIQNSTENIISDFNGDGYMDICKASFVRNVMTCGYKKYSTLNIYLFQPLTNTFSESVCTVNLPTTISVNDINYPFYGSIHTADIDGNGKSEIVITHKSFGNLGYPCIDSVIYGGFSIYSNLDTLYNPTNTTQFPTNDFYYMEEFEECLLTGDFDGDGKDDIISLPNDVIYYNGLSTTKPISYAIPSGSVYFSFSTYDYNLDGKDDVNLKYRDTYGNQYNNILKARFYSNVVALEKEFVDVQNFTYFGDFNGDNLIDYLEIQQNNSATIYYNGIFKAFTFSEPVNNTKLDMNNEFIGVVDFNKDNKSDIIHIYKPEGMLSYKYAIYYSNGSSFKRVEYNAISTPLSSGKYPIFEDFNNDGYTDLLTSGGVVVYFKAQSIERNLISIKNGHNITVSYEYKLASQPNAIYTLSGSNTGYPIRKYTPKDWLVSKVIMPDGSGNLSQTSYTSYSYTNAKMHAVRGFLGFEKIKTTDSLTTLVNEVNYSILDNSKLIVIPATSKTYYSATPNTLLSETTNIYQIADYGNKRYWVKNIENTDFNYITKVRTFRQTDYDNSTGNINSEMKQITAINTPSTNIQTTTTQYSNYTNAGSWLAHLPETITTSNSYKTSDVYTTTTKNSYNGNGQLTQSIAFYGSGGKEITTTNEYFPIYGQLKQTTSSIVDNTPRYTRYEYFQNQRTIKKTFNSLEQCTAEVLEYDKRYNQATKIKTLEGTETTITTDALGRNIQTSVKYPSGNGIPNTIQTTTTAYFWDIDNTKNQLYRTETTDPYNTVSKIYTDNLGRTIKTITKNFNGDNVENSQEFDNFGRVIKQTGYDATDALAATTYEYKGKEQHYRLASIATPFNISTYTNPTYNSNGNTITLVTESNGAFKKQTTDAAGFLLISEDNGGIVKYAYNSQGKLTSTKLNEIVTNNMTYDAVNGTPTKIETAGTVYTYKYNSWGELTEQTDNQSTPNKYKMEYDVLGRLKKRYLVAGGELTEYFYNSTGNGINQIQKVTLNGTVDKAYTYDARHRLTAETQYIDDSTFTTTLQYYDADNKLWKITYPGDFTLRYEYKANGYLEKIFDEGLGYYVYTAYTTNKNGQPKTYKLRNGCLTTITYQPNGYPSNYKAQKAPNQYVLQDLDMTFDNYGNLTYRKDKLQNQQETFTYNTTLDQLKSISTNGSTPKAINYAANGNIINKYDAGITDNATDETYTYSNLYALTKIKEKCTATAQNTPLLAEHTTPQTITYTAFNQPNTIVENDTTVTFTYNSNYERIKSVWKKGNTIVRTRYYVGNYEKEIDPANTRQMYYVYAGSQLIGISVKTNNAGRVYYTAYTDHLGSLLTLTENSGTAPKIVAQQSFDAWGRYRNPKNWNDYNYTDSTSVLGKGKNGYLRRGYTMHEHYKEYGLINMNGRLYDPIAGRMLSPDIYVQDPTNSQNYNRYSYVLNNPLKYTDPSGWKYTLEKTNSVDDPPINFENFHSNYGGSGGGGFSYNFAGSYSMYASDPEMYAFMYGTQTWMQTATATAAVISALSSAYAMLSKSGTGTQHIRGQNNVGNAGEQKIRSLSYTWTFNSGNTSINNGSNYINAIAQVGGGGASGGGGIYSGNNIFVKTYLHYQFGGTKPLDVSTSSLDLSGISMQTPEIQNIVKKGSDYINLFSYMKNQTGLAIGSVKMNYLGNNTFSLSPDVYDFDIRWKDGSTSRNWATFFGGLLHGPVIDNIPVPIGGPFLFGPSFFWGGKYSINFHGTIILKP